MISKTNHGIKLGNNFLLGVLLFFPMADILELWARAYANGPLGIFLCGVRPYISITDVFFSRQLIDFAATQCQQGQPQDPAYFIIWMMIKLFVPLLGGLLLTIYSAFQLDFKLSPRSIEAFQKKGVIRVFAEGWILLIVFGLFFYRELWRVSLWNTPEKFSALLGALSADFLAIYLFLASGIFFNNLYEIIVILTAKIRAKAG